MRRRPMKCCAACWQFRRWTGLLAGRAAGAVLVMQVLSISYQHTEQSSVISDDCSNSTT